MVTRPKTDQHCRPRCARYPTQSNNTKKDNVPFRKRLSDYITKLNFSNTFQPSRSDVQGGRSMVYTTAIL